ncbi:hypothetical protein F2Q69_00007401 [Brassica cretica]|uniref:Uncharacterized protein n=1 Tax=Brassica cretica TaxID=69181 RepID=A0A8S9NYJ4_BRACR|nr:hypothetical protein F2Q69_00007401 [Brassica cretica]
MGFCRRTKRRFDTGSTAPVSDKHPWPSEREDEPIPLFDHFADTRAAAKRSKCRNRAIEDTWDDYDSIFYYEWLRVSIELPGSLIRTSAVRRSGPVQFGEWPSWIKRGFSSAVCRAGPVQLGERPGWIKCRFSSAVRRAGPVQYGELPSWIDRILSSPRPRNSTPEIASNSFLFHLDRRYH